MNLKPIRKYRRRISRTQGIIKGNPVLSLGLALPFVVIASTTLQRGAMMSLIMFVAIVPSVLVIKLFENNLPAWLRLPVGCGVSFLCIVLLTNGLDTMHPVLLDDLGVYVPMAAFNMILIECLSGRDYDSPLSAVAEAFKFCLGFALVMCMVSTVREWLTFQTIWDIPLRLLDRPVSGAALPCFGFIILGFSAAFFRAFERFHLRMLIRFDNNRHIGEEETA